jgi:Xaa-Pro aminopeptidase
LEKASPIILEKAIKNKTELEGMRNAHIRDGAALVKTFAWIQERLDNNDDSQTEITVADYAEKMRRYT